jgi:cytochrome c oxidase subunit 1
MAEHIKTMPEPNYLEYRGKYKGLLGWLTTTDHKRIGLMYFYSMMTFFLAGVVLGLLMKLELISPGE